MPWCVLSRCRGPVQAWVPPGVHRGIYGRDPGARIGILNSDSQWQRGSPRSGWSSGPPRAHQPRQSEGMGMALDTSTATEQGQDLTVEQKISRLRELFADAPEVGKKALENILGRLASDASGKPPPVESAGRVGSRLGKVSELTIIVPFAPGGSRPP